MPPSTRTPTATGRPGALADVDPGRRRGRRAQAWARPRRRCGWRSPAGRRAPAVRVARGPRPGAHASPGCGRPETGWGDVAGGLLRLGTVRIFGSPSSASSLLYVGVTFVQVVAGVPTAIGAQRATPSSCWAPPSTTASRRRCCGPGSTTPRALRGGSRRPGRRDRGAASPATSSPRPGAAVPAPSTACPTRAILREVQGRNSWESLAAAARILQDAGRRRRAARLRPVPLAADGGHRRRGRPRRPRVADRRRARPSRDGGAALWPGRRPRSQPGGSSATGRLMSLDGTVARVRRPGPRPLT